MIKKGINNLISQSLEEEEEMESQEVRNIY